MNGYDFKSIKLGCGSHPEGKGVGCFMEAASYLAGEEWSDTPQCVCPLLAHLGRTMNDIMRSDVRNKYLLPRLFSVLNTSGTGVDMARRAAIFADYVKGVLDPMGGDIPKWFHSPNGVDSDNAAIVLIQYYRHFSRCGIRFDWAGLMEVYDRMIEAGPHGPVEIAPERLEGLKAVCPAKPVACGA